MLVAQGDEAIGNILVALVRAPRPRERVCMFECRGVSMRGLATRYRLADATIPCLHQRAACKKKLKKPTLVLYSRCCSTTFH